METMNQALNSTSRRVVSLVFAVFLSIGLLCAGCGSCPKPTQDVPVEKLRPEIINTFSFDSSSFTQGLEFDHGQLLVGTGQYGRSEIYRAEIGGSKLQSERLGPEFFGEGIAKSGDTIWQLTWREHTAFKRDSDSLQVLDTATYSGEGWGLCAFADFLVMSDGSASLRFLEPQSFTEKSSLQVTLAGSPVPQLNELACVGEDEIFANVFQSTDILRIDVHTGRVTAVIDASAVPNNAEPDVDNVLNGIAHIPETDHFFITGKHWPDLYEVSFVAAN